MTSDIIFALFYGAILIFVIYMLFHMFRGGASSTTTIIYETPETPIYEVPVYQTPVTDTIYPWYSGYNWWPYWGYGMYGGYGGYGGYTRPYHGHHRGVRSGIRGGGARGGGARGGRR
jgi:hypothetical protein